MAAANFKMWNKIKKSHVWHIMSCAGKVLYILLTKRFVILLATLFYSGVHLFLTWWFDPDMEKPEYYLDAITIVGSVCGGIILAINAIFLYR